MNSSAISLSISTTTLLSSTKKLTTTIQSSAISLSISTISPYLNTHPILKLISLLFGRPEIKNMAEAILFGLAKFVIGNLSSQLFDEVKAALGVEDEIDRMTSNLSSIQAVLRDAEKQQSTSESVKDWLHKLQNVMYDIDDLLDEIATEIAILNKNKGQMYKQVRKFFSRSNINVLRLLWPRQIKVLCKKLDRIADERKNFVLSTDSTDSAESTSRETHSMVNASEILGRDEDKEAIINSILSCADSERISVLPIAGMGGIGKTTFAKLIYNSERIDNNFSCKLWVHISQKFKLKKILRQIISMVTGGNYVDLTMEQLALEELRIKVTEALKDKKYFLMLDDLWNEDSNEWRQFKEILDVGAKGSMVVVTTRDSKVGSMVTTTEEYNLSELSDETCLQMFMQLAFKEGEEVEPGLVILATKIVEKSRGIPLLVTTLGNLLRGKTDERDWHLVITKLEEGHNDIMDVLKLSYEQLPSHIKMFFRTFSIYGKGTEVFGTHATDLWMSLEFLSHDNRGGSRESLESIGWNYIDALCSKSLLQKVKLDSPSMGGYWDKFLMHDFMYDLARSMAGDELTIMDSSTITKVSENTRYIRLDEDYLAGSQSHQKQLNKAKKARLLMLKTSEHPLSMSFLENIISKFKFLRALDLENCQFEELPRTIGYMKHLRYLCLSNNMRIKSLPNSICNLLNLQTLDVSGCISLRELPNEIGRLENLRYLWITIQHETLPESIGLLTQLRVLELYECPMLAFLPLSTNQLPNLEILFIMNCRQLNLAHGSWFLQGLNNLRILMIMGLPKLQKLPIGVSSLPFTSLRIVYVSECEGLIEITDFFHSTSLKELVIFKCPNLVILPQTLNILKAKGLERLRIEGYTH